TSNLRNPSKSHCKFCCATYTLPEPFTPVDHRTNHMNSFANRLFALEVSSPLTNTALLVLRLWLGLTIALNHGWDKLAHFSEKAEKFPDVTGLGSTTSLCLAVFAEFFCGALLALGLVTRFAALMLCATMAVAFARMHKFALSGPGNGELAF